MICCLMLLLVISVPLPPDVKRDGKVERRQRCWVNGVTWYQCCAPWLGPTGDPLCWSPGYSYERCCLSSPEFEPMESDLDGCRNDPVLRKVYKLLSHFTVGLRPDCTSAMTCR